MIADEMNSLKKTLGEDVTEDVVRQELVARGCELMLTDANSIKELAKRDKGLFGKIKAKIDEWVKNIIKACNSIINKDGSIKSGTVSKEAMLLKDFALQMRTMWNEALKEAGESNSIQNTSEQSQAYSERKPNMLKDNEGNDVVIIPKRTFSKRSMKSFNDFKKVRKEVERMLKQLSGKSVLVKDNNKIINFDNDFADEYTHSKDTINSNTKQRSAKMNVVSEMLSVVENAKYKNHQVNVKEKKRADATGGFDYYTIKFAMPTDSGNYIIFKGILNTRIDKSGKGFAYDIIKISVDYGAQNESGNIPPSTDKGIKAQNKKDVNKNILYSYAGERSTNADTKGLEKARDTSNRMNLSEKERREKIPEKGNENTVHRFFSLRQSVEETKDLIAVHNLSEKNLYKRIRENLIERLNRYKLEDDYEIFKGNVEPIFDQTSYDEAVDEYVNKHSEQYTKYIEDALENVYEDKYLVKEDVEPLKANGERKSFNKLHMPYEINNIVTLMKKQKKGKGGGFFGGAGNLKGAATETFTSIDEIRRNKYKIQNISKDELRKKYNSLNSKIQEIDNYILREENDDVEARLRKTENINETMVEAFALDKFTKSNVKEKFNDSNIEITDSVYEQMKELRDELKEIPVQYFEAKPERAVSTNEIAYVVVPNSVSEKTKEALRKNGIEYKEYAAGDKEARKKAVNSDSTVLFQNRNYSYDELVKKPPMNIPVVKAKAISEINRKSIVEMAMNNIKSHKGIEFRGKNPIVTNIDTGDKIQVTTGGIRHGLAGRTNEAGIFVTMNLTEAIENGIKVNESSFGRKNADSSYILIGAMDNEAKERYYYRLVVNRYESNNMGTYYVDDLYAVRAKKEETFTAVMPTRVTADADASNISSKLNVSDFLKAVKDYYGFELSKDVNENNGLFKGNT
mgnify:CR=1 FL=1